jgi:5-methylcytosine-specific restriction protein A
MPKTSRRLCPSAGCTGLYDGKTCTVCGVANKENRKNARQRGYDYQWEKYRKYFLSQFPLCQVCKKKGNVTPATVVHHIVPVTSHDDVLFYDQENHMAVCRDCHERIHGRKK